jgi:hypothetical protein
MARKKEHMVLGPCHKSSKTQGKFDLNSKATGTDVPPLMPVEEPATRRQGFDRIGEDADSRTLQKPKPWAAEKHLQHNTTPCL